VLKMNWWKRLVENWKKFIEDTAKANDQMWKDQKPSCCALAVKARFIIFAARGAKRKIV